MIENFLGQNCNQTKAFDYQKDQIFQKVLQKIIKQNVACIELTHDIVYGARYAPFAQLSISFFVLELSNVAGDRFKAQPKKRLCGEHANEGDQNGDALAVVGEPGDRGEGHGEDEKMQGLDLQIGEHGALTDEYAEKRLKRDQYQVDKVADACGGSHKFFGLFRVEIIAFAEFAELRDEQKAQTVEPDRLSAQVDPVEVDVAHTEMHQRGAELKEKSGWCIVNVELAKVHGGVDGVASHKERKDKGVLYAAE